jgi:transposase
MTLGNMRELGVHHLIAYCLNDACRHQALIDVSSYPAETEVPYFRDKVVCAKCGSRQPVRPTRLRWD